MKLFGRNRRDDDFDEELDEEPIDEEDYSDEVYEDEESSDDEVYDDEVFDDDEDYIDDEEYYDDEAYDDEDYDDAYDDEYDDEFDEEYDEDEDYDDEDEYEEKPRMGRGKKVLIAVAVVLVVILGATGLFINYILNLINYQAANSDYFATVSTPEELPEETPVTSYMAVLEEEEEAKSLEATASEMETWDQEIDDITSDSSTYEVPISDDVYNILLIGSDTRTSGKVGRSDAMILVSLNQKTKTIYLTSFLRDCYVNIPGYGHTRLNHSFAYGGPALLEETLENNFKVHVDKYVAVDFYSFMDVIDVLGGIDVDISEDEQEVTNDYIWSMNQLMGEEWSTDYIWNPGYQHLNGKQALCYARNRYTGNDYARTQRQRTVINLLIDKAFSSSPATLVELAQVILPQVTTDMEKTEVLSYAANVAAYLDYDIQQQQIPADGTYSNATISGMSVIKLDFDSNISLLQSTIYAGTDAVSDTSETTTNAQ